MGTRGSSRRRNAAARTGDDTLGINSLICRRDFLKSMTPLEPLGQTPSWVGYTGEGDYAGANGNTEEVMLAAHAVRDGQFDTSPAAAEDSGEVFDLVIVDRESLEQSGPTSRVVRIAIRFRQVFEAGQRVEPIAPPPQGRGVPPLR